MLRVTVPVPVRLARQVSIGQRLAVLVPDLPGRVWPAVVQKISLPTPPGPADVLLQLLLANPGDNPRFRPGMHVRLRLPTRAPAASTPAAAVP
jgi:hypothetical protein